MAFGLVVLVVFLLALEGVLALLGLGDADPFPDPFVGFRGSTSLFVRAEEEGEARWVTRPNKLEFFNAQSFPVEKPPGSLRIFTLGGSTTAGRPYDDRVSFARWLERYLELAEPGRGHAVINAGAISYASYRVVRLMKELVRYEPDVFVVYTGHNEFLEERSYRDVRRSDDPLDSLRGWLVRRRTTVLLRQTLGRSESEESEEGPEEGTATLGDDVRTRLDVWNGLDAYRRDDALAADIVRHFAFNLQQMVAIARAHDVRLLLVAPASNLKDFSPFKSQHRDDLTAADRRRFEGHMRKGHELLASGESAAAVEAFAAARQIDPEHAEAAFRQARALWDDGRAEAAHPLFVRAKELDVAPLRAREVLVEQVRETARDEGLVWVDLPALLAEGDRGWPRSPTPGAEAFLDHVHPDLEIHALLAAELVDRLAEAGLIEPASSYGEDGRRRIREEALASLDRSYYARRDLNLAKVLGWAGKLEEAEAPLRRAARELVGVADLHLNLGTLLQKTGRPEEALVELERARELAPGSPRVFFNLGVVHARLGQLEQGAEALRRALELQPDWPEALHNLGVVELEVGDVASAVEHLRRSAALSPEVAEVQLALARALRRAGEDDAAEAAYRRAVQRAPESLEARVELAVALARSGRGPEAEHELRQILEDDPENAEAHYNRGLLLAARGELDAARTAYERAIEAAPGHALAHNNLGILLARQGDLDAARRRLETAISLDDELAEGFLNLGVVYDRGGQPHRALQSVERAVSLAPDVPRFRFALAMLLFASDRLDDARPHFEAARAGGLEPPAEIATRLGWDAVEGPGAEGSKG